MGKIFMRGCQGTQKSNEISWTEFSRTTAAYELAGNKKILGMMIIEGLGSANAAIPSEYWQRKPTPRLSRKRSRTACHNGRRQSARR
jgi:hypothetical protein